MFDSNNKGIVYSQHMKRRDSNRSAFDDEDDMDGGMSISNFSKAYESANVYRDTREMGERTPCIHTKANFEGEYVMSGSRYGASTHQELPKYDLLEARDLYKTQNPREYVIKSRQR